MAELDQVLFDLIKPMVNDSENLEVRMMPSLNEKELVLHVYAKNNDIAKLIGRKGMMASALRQVMGIAAHTENKRITIKFEEM